MKTCRQKQVGRGENMMNSDEYYLELRDSISIMDLYTEEPCDARFHFHEDYEIYLFQGGDVDLYIEQSFHHMQRGHLAVFNDREIHRACHYGEIPYKRIAVHFNPRLIQGMSTRSTNLLGYFQNHRPGRDNVILLSEEQMDNLIKLCKRLDGVSSSPEYGADILTVSCLAELLVYVNLLYRQFRQEKPVIPDKTMTAILDYIDTHLSPELSLASIAECFSIDRYYLSHLFKQQTGNTLYHYILIKKTAAAKQLLTEGKSVTEACYLSGFNDYNNFIRTFKKIAGISPGQYQKGFLMK